MTTRIEKLIKLQENLVESLNKINVKLEKINAGLCLAKDLDADHKNFQYSVSEFFLEDDEDDDSEDEPPRAANISSTF